MDEFFKYFAPIVSLLGSLIAFVYGYAKLEGRVILLEKELDKQFSDNGRVGKLEKYSGLHFDSIGKLNETNIKLAEKVETMTKAFDGLHAKIDRHIDDDAKTATMIQEILRVVKKDR